MRFKGVYLSPYKMALKPLNSYHWFARLVISL
nr:MAG TPA: hypothetical protein [Caudoviricetes sp.]